MGTDMVFGQMVQGQMAETSGQALSLSASMIRRDGGTQSRALIDRDTVEEYRQAMEHGDLFPPLEVLYDGVSYWLWDGFHRFEAGIRAGIDEFWVNVRPGTREQAQWLSYGANGRHGLRRTNADKRRAVEAALRMRPDFTDRAIAQHTAVDPKTVGTIRQQLESTGEIPQCETRVGLDGRAQAVGNIGTVAGVGVALAESGVVDFGDGGEGLEDGDGTVEETEAEGLPAISATAHEDTEWPSHAMETTAAIPAPTKLMGFPKKEAPEGGWPVLREDGTYDDDAAEVLVDADGQRWVDIKILELEPDGLFAGERWIAAFSIGCKPCIATEPLGEEGAGGTEWRTRQEALKDAAMRLALYTWRNIQDGAIPKTARTVLQRFHEWALKQGMISNAEFEREIEKIAAALRQRIMDRAEMYKSVVCDLCFDFKGSASPVEDFSAIAREIVSQIEPGCDRDEVAEKAIENIDDAIARLSSLSAALKIAVEEQAASAASAASAPVEDSRDSE